MSLLTNIIGTVFHPIHGQCDVYDLINERTVRIQCEFVQDIPVDECIYLSENLLKKIKTLKN